MSALPNDFSVALAHDLNYFSADGQQPVTTDSVLLAAFAAEKLDQKRRVVCDLFAGSGLLSLLAARRSPRITLTGIDIDENACRLYRKNAAENGLTARMTAICRDAAALTGQGLDGRFDAVIANPPYFSDGRGAASPNPARQTARQGCPLEAMADAAALLLKNGGALFLCYPAERLAELICALSARSLIPKRLRMVAHTAEKRPSIVLLEAVKGAAHGLICEKTLIQYEKNGAMTADCAAMYALP